MILLSNVKITNTRLYNPNRGTLCTHDRMDVWKYTLTSYASLLPLLSKVCLYIDLASTEYAGQEPILEEYIKSIFPEDKLILKWVRNNSTADWRKSCLEDIFPGDDDIILNMTNDDHIFIDTDLENISTLINHLKNSNDPYAQIIVSHWPEVIRKAAAQRYSPTNDLSCVVGRGHSVESFDICKKERWRHYWFDFDCGDALTFRPEGIPHEIRFTKVVPNGNETFIPLRELFRHFDGYEHAAPFLNSTPSLEIPPGFFEKQIKISYGYNYPKEGYVNINPLCLNYKAFSNDGVDYRYSLEDIPLFWKDRIIEIDINPESNLDQLRFSRDTHFYERAMSQIVGCHVSPLQTPYHPALFQKQFLVAVAQ